MSKNIITNAIASTGNISARHASEIYDAVLQAIVSETSRSGKLTLHRFGSFKLRVRPPGEHRSPIDGTKLQIPRRATIAFSPALSLRETVTGLLPSEEGPKIGRPKKTSTTAASPKATTPTAPKAKAAAKPKAKAAPVRAGRPTKTPGTANPTTVRTAKTAAPKKADTKTTPKKGKKGARGSDAKQAKPPNLHEHRTP